MNNKKILGKISATKYFLSEFFNVAIEVMIFVWGSILGIFLISISWIVLKVFENIKKLGEYILDKSQNI